jgi:hypothetical protein
MNKILFRIAILLIRVIEFNLAASLLIGAIDGLIYVLWGE